MEPALKSGWFKFLFAQLWMLTFLGPKIWVCVCGQINFQKNKQTENKLLKAEKEPFYNHGVSHFHSYQSFSLKVISHI